MKISLENWLRDKLYETERNHDYEVGTETVRAWIDQYNDLKKLIIVKFEEWSQGGA